MVGGCGDIVSSRQYVSVSLSTFEKNLGVLQGEIFCFFCPENSRCRKPRGESFVFFAQRTPDVGNRNLGGSIKKSK